MENCWTPWQPQADTSDFYDSLLAPIPLVASLREGPPDAASHVESGLAEQLECPQLSASPRAAIDMAMEIAQGQLRKMQASPQTLTIVGSSLGGYYATWLAEQLGCKAVLLNPAVHAPCELAKHVGTHRLYHSDEPFVFLPHYADELAALQVHRITRPERYFLIAATGDEVLDWTEMRDHYPACRQRIVQGSDTA